MRIDPYWRYAQVAMPRFLLYFCRPSHWHTPVFAHVFQARPAIADTIWPGIALKELERDWYELELDGVERAKVVFNDGNGAQTDDLHGEHMTWYELGVGWSSAPPDTFPAVRSRPPPADMIDAP